MEFEDGTTSSNSTTSNPSYRTRPILTNYSHCMENGIGTEADDIMREPRLPFDVLVGILRLKLQGNGRALMCSINICAWLLEHFFMCRWVRDCLS